jgi:putative transposase
MPAGILTAPDGEYIGNPCFREKSERKLARLSRRLSRKPKDSNNREKARIKLARAHEKVRNQRNDYLDRLSARLVREYDLIRVGDFRAPAAMVDGRSAKRAADAGYGILLAKLRYKCGWYGRELLIAGEDPAKTGQTGKRVRPDGPEPAGIRALPGFPETPAESAQCGMGRIAR